VYPGMGITVSPAASADGVLEAKGVDELELGDVAVCVGAVETEAGEQPTTPKSSATTPTGDIKRPRITESPISARDPQPVAHRHIRDYARSRCRRSTLSGEMTADEAVQVTYKLDDIVPVIQIHKRLEHDQKGRSGGRQDGPGKGSG
jgi:hypothetical protein